MATEHLTPDVAHAGDIAPKWQLWTGRVLSALPAVRLE